MKDKERNKIIGNRIKQLRIKNHETQSMLAEKINISQTSISKLENGTTSLSLENQLNITKHYNVSPNYLCSDDTNDTILETLKKYVRFEYASMTLGEESFLCPKIIIEKSFYEYLLKSALANKESYIPDEIRKAWLQDIEKKFYEANKDSNYSVTDTFVLLPEDLISPCDQKNDWKQADLLRELNNKLISSLEC